MDQRTHTWIAIRAVDLLDQIAETKGLAALLKPSIKSAAIGAWIPDLQDAKLGSGRVENHILKMKPYTGYQKKRFTVNKKDLLKKLGKHRSMYAFLKNDAILDEAWWNLPYKADPPPGQHLANRAMSLSITLIDLLILGDPDVAALVPGTIAFTQNLNPKTRSCGEQVSLYFFMLSHFIADSCMPCHCDARDLAAYGNGYHDKLEKHWSKRIGPYFDKTNLYNSLDDPAVVLAKASDLD